MFNVPNFERRHEARICTNQTSDFSRSRPSTIGDIFIEKIQGHPIVNLEIFFISVLKVVLTREYLRTKSQTKVRVTVSQRPLCKI